MALEALLTRSVYPSIDATRVELGHTGSRSSIQRHLKELSAPQALTVSEGFDDELIRLPLRTERLHENATGELIDSLQERGRHLRLNLDEYPAREHELQAAHDA